MKVRINNLSLTFYGTKGLIEGYSKTHYFHTSILISSNKTKVLLDYGEKNQKNLEKIKPDYCLNSHSHKDHLPGFAEKEIICSKASYKTAYKNFPKLRFKFKKIFDYYKPFNLKDIKFIPIPVYHSLLAPMTAFIIQKEGTKIWIGTDFLSFRAGDFDKYFRDINVAVIDGSSIFRDLVRLKNVNGRNVPYGHASIVRQLSKMRDRVKDEFIVTHCGSNIIETGDRLTLVALQKITPNVKIADDEK